MHSSHQLSIKWAGCFGVFPTLVLEGGEERVRGGRNGTMCSVKDRVAINYTAAEKLHVEGKQKVGVV